MKIQLKFNSVLLNVLLLFFFSLGTYSLQAQTAKKNTLRLKVNYVKDMNEGPYFDVTASARIDRKNVTIPNVELLVYNEFNEESELIGKIKTNMKGESKFSLGSIDKIQPDSATQVYTVKFMFKGNDAFKKASRSATFKDADIQAEVIQIDSTYQITATLTDKGTNLPIENLAIGVQLQRLFMPHQIEEFSVTDENGTIIVPIESGIPGVDGNLNLEVILNDSDDYGTVKAMVVAPIGTPIVDKSTFDERTMWSPRNKTPIFLLIFPNLLIFGMWGLIIYLITNLYKITKS